MSAAVHRFSSWSMRVSSLLMLSLLTGMAFFAAQAPPAMPVAPIATPQAWDPAKDYISAGQDEPGYRSWYLAAPWRAAQVKAFNDYLASEQVSGVLPTWQLLRTATSWRECGGQPFEVPPSDEWPHMVQTLRYVRDYVIPAVGPVRSEEHTSELQSHVNLVCRLLLEKKKRKHLQPQS